MIKADLTGVEKGKGGEEKKGVIRQYILDYTLRLHLVYKSGLLDWQSFNSQGHIARQ